MSIAEHLVASTRGRERGLLEPERASWLWVRLRRAFPDALSCVFMPDHLHLVAAPGGRPALGSVLGRYAARFGVGFDILPPQPAESRPIALRMIRYGFFNAVRAELVDDPWLWQWSTLHDLAGATHPAWTPLSRIARKLWRRPGPLLAALTRLGDHHPSPPRSEPVAAATPTAILRAVGRALRIPEARSLATCDGRRLAVQACVAVGATSTRHISRALDLPERSVRRYRAPTHPGLPAVLRILQDPRLSGA